MIKISQSAQEAAWIPWTDCSDGLLSDLVGKTQPGVERRRFDQMNADFNRNFSQWPYLVFP